MTLNLWHTRQNDKNNLRVQWHCTLESMVYSTTILSVGQSMCCMEMVKPNINLFLLICGLLIKFSHTKQHHKIPTESRLSVINLQFQNKYRNRKICVQYIYISILNKDKFVQNINRKLSLLMTLWPLNDWFNTKTFSGPTLWKQNMYHLWYNLQKIIINLL